MIKCINVYNTRSSGGHAYWQCMLLADAEPEEMPTSGAGIENLLDTVMLDDGSMLIVLAVSKKYIYWLADQSWHEWEG